MVSETETGKHQVGRAESQNQGRKEQNQNRSVNIDVQPGYREVEFNPGEGRQLQGALDVWPFQPKIWSQEQTTQATNNEEWKSFTQVLEGLATPIKLYRLYCYLEAQAFMNKTEGQRPPEAAQCRVDNYIGALKRANLLSLSNKVLR